MTLFFQVLMAVSLSAVSAVRTKRQRHGDDDKQVIVNIENEEKTQYLQQDFNTSKTANHLLVTLECWLSIK